MMIREETQYVTDDGATFDNITEAMVHEDKLNLAFTLLKEGYSALEGVERSDKVTSADTLAEIIYRAYDISPR